MYFIVGTSLTGKKPVNIRAYALGDEKKHREIVQTSQILRKVATGMDSTKGGCYNSAYKRGGEYVACLCASSNSRRHGCKAYED